jgi:hypothetical protein
MESCLSLLFRKNLLVQLQFDRERFWRIFWFVFSLFQKSSSVCFGCFDTGPKHQNKPEKFFWVSRNKPKNNQNRLSFGSNRKKN